MSGRVRDLRSRRARSAARGRDGRADGGRARPPGPRRRRLVRGGGGRARVPPARDHRPERGREPAVRERGRRALRADPETRLEPNPRAVRDYLDQAYLDHTDETFFAGLRKLPPAHSLVVDEHGLRLSRYWTLEEHEPPAGDAADALRELFLDSIRLRLRSDVPAGTALSGGLDSSAIAVVVDRLLHTEKENAVAVGPRQRTFTPYFEVPGFDERPYARAVVERTAAEPRWITFGPEELAGDLPAIVAAQGEPFGSTSICAGWYVMREARRAGVTVMLDGQGGDEVLAGYRAHLGFRLADLLAAGRLRELGEELRSFHGVHSASALVTAMSRPFAPEALTRLVRSRTRGAGALVHPDLRGLEPAPAPNGSPFPHLLRPIVRERRDKLGFVTPERRWLRGGLGELAGDVFSSRSFAERGFVDAD